MPADPKMLVDGFSVLDGGIDTGKNPALLRPNQLSFGVNLNLRGGFARPRPEWKKVILNWPSEVVEGRQKNGRFQVAGYYKPDLGSECLLASIGGRQFRFNVATDNSVQEITITFQTTTTANFIPPAIGFNVTITVVNTGRLSVGAQILVNGKTYTVETIISATQVAIKNVDDDGSVNPVPSGSPVISYDPNPSTRKQAWEVQAEKWWILRDGQSIPFIYDGSTSRRAASNVSVENGKEIGPGRMMDYVLGRIWGALTDDRSYKAGDLVFGSSGTAAEEFRDAVLKETENTFLNTGGVFTVPTSSAPISAIRGLANMDTSLGQGPVQILTPNNTFTNNSPLDRTVWASMENPIQTVSLITNGGLSHYGSILVNGDLLYRAIDGIRSYRLARQEFNSWGNTPISREMNRITEKDNENLLQYSNAVVFDNRLLMTCSPVFTDHGIYHRGLISLDFDLISAIGQKSPPVYNGVWVGLSILQLVKGQFNGEERCFAFCLNGEQEIELYEIKKQGYFDHYDETARDIPILWSFETGQFHFGTDIYPQRRLLKKLNNLELEISNLIGEVTFRVYYKPDNYPCWVFWKEFTQCASLKDCTIEPLTGCLTNQNFQPQFRPRLSLGEPENDCDPINNRSLRLGYSFQVRVEIEGYCEIRQLILATEIKDETYFGKLVGCE